MINEDIKSIIKYYLCRFWRNSFGPVEYDSPSAKQCEDLGFTHEEGIAFYGECLKKSEIVEIKPGFWGYKTDTSLNSP